MMLVRHAPFLYYIKTIYILQKVTRYQNHNWPARTAHTTTQRQHPGPGQPAGQPAGPASISTSRPPLSRCITNVNTIPGYININQRTRRYTTTYAILKRSPKTRLGKQKN